MRKLLSAMIDVVDLASRGRGVVASRDIPAGTELVRALPYAVVPSDDALLSHCCVCLAPAADAEACSRCGMAVLCARCAASPIASLVHEDECAALQRLACAPVHAKPRRTRSLRLLLRCLCARWRGPYVAGGGGDGAWWGAGDLAIDEAEDVEDLVGPPDDDDSDSDSDGSGGSGGSSSDADEAGGGERGRALGADLFEMAKQARYFADSRMRVGHDACAALMGQLCCNSLTIYGRREAREERREVGVALSASVAMFNHDCTPNSAWSIDEDGCLVVTTIARVRAGAELCLSYVDTRLPAATRRRRLRQHFFFDCACAACAADAACWTCALCGAHNGAFGAERTACGHCAAARFEAPLGGRKRKSAPERTL